MNGAILPKAFRGVRDFFTIAPVASRTVKLPRPCMTLIDWDLLNALKADIGEEDFADVITLFVAEISEKIEEMRRGPDGPGADDFHFLKGSAANLGFTAMSAACDTAEAACRAGQAGDLDTVEAAFLAALREARPHLPELAAA
jgi:HPt (histidine-containing phosphotransfer) domain-containing protein